MDAENNVITNFGSTEPKGNAMEATIFQSCVLGVGRYTLMYDFLGYVHQLYMNNCK